MKKFFLSMSLLTLVLVHNSYGMGKKAYVSGTFQFQCERTGLQFLVHSRYSYIDSVEVKERDKENWETLEIQDREKIFSESFLTTNRGHLSVTLRSNGTSASWDGSELELSKECDVSVNFDK